MTAEKYKAELAPLPVIMLQIAVRNVFLLDPIRG